MTTINLRAPLRDLAGGNARVDVPGSTVAEALRALERAHPATSGWVLDEQGRIRTHVNVFLNGERAAGEAAVNERDEIHIIAAISGGADAELLVGTHKGLFVLRGERGGPLDVVARAFAGSSVEYAMRDPGTGRYLASVTHGQFGPHIFYTDDPGEQWVEARGPAFDDDSGATVVRTWVVTPGERDGLLWAGVQPAALFRSDDGGESWALNRGLWDEPSRPQWQPGAGGLALHSICPWPGDPTRLAVGISAAGVWISDDEGASWRRSNTGIVARYLPEEARESAVDLCVHNLHRAPLQPESLYMQFHGGVYRSDDAGATWIDIADGLPSDFGFPMVVDPHASDRAFVIPLNSDGDRVTVDGKVRVYETRDRGAMWTPRGDGLPDRDAYLTVLRQAFCHDGGDPLGLYFGATSGTVYGSADGGATWSVVASDLAPVYSVRPGA